MGGLAGHMMHPHDNLDLTIKQFIGICTGSLRGAYMFKEKLDGFNIHILNYKGQLKFARNATDLAAGGFGKVEMDNRFTNERVRGIYKWAWCEMMRFKELYLSMLPDFTDNGVTLNVEVLFGKTNIIPYKTHKLVPHNFQYWTNDNGKYKQCETRDLDGNCVEYSPAPYDYDSITEILMDIFKRYGLTEEHTLRDYYHIKFIHVLQESGYSNLLESYQRSGVGPIFNRFFKDGTQTNLRSIRKMFINSIDEVLTDEKLLVRKTKQDLDGVVLRIGTMILENVTCINSEHQYEVCAEIERDLQNIEKDPIQTERWSQTGYKIFPLEGVVIRTNDGQHYKWTGPFAPLNQMLGGQNK